ncbi:MAG: 2-oxo acid dehydrogenase subunit E2 [Armatimonadetes bacterium]|nr:2-oxo acid dehydrogenase subunit E2 [Armatimonadota bacterium]
MATKVTLPLLGQTMEEGTIIKWFKNEGDSVEKEEPLLEVMTDKANMEVESPAAGTLLKIVAGPDATVPVKALIGVIGDKGEDISGILAEAGAPSGGDEPAAASKTDGQSSAQPAVKATPSPTTGPSTDRILASPRARKLAEENNIDLALLQGQGSGPGGRIIEKDVQRAISEGLGAAAAAAAASPLAGRIAQDTGVEIAGVTGTGPGGKVYSQDVLAAAASATPAAQAPAPTLAPRVNLGQVIPFSGLRKAVADNLEKSARSVIPVTLTMGVDMSEVVRLRDQIKPLYAQRYGVKLSFTDIVVKAAARALEDHPMLNSSLEGNQIRVHDAVNVSIAIAVPDGLVAPVVADANLKPLWAISSEIRQMAETARAGKYGTLQMAGGTFSVTNLGTYGVEQFNAIINPPQCAILAVCAIKEQPVVVSGQVEVRPIMNLCLTFDHRIVDGAPGAAYLQRLKELLEMPYLILA